VAPNSFNRRRDGRGNSVLAPGHMRRGSFPKPLNNLLSFSRYSCNVISLLKMRRLSSESDSITSLLLFIRDSYFESVDGAAATSALLIVGSFTNTCVIPESLQAKSADLKRYLINLQVASSSRKKKTLSMFTHLSRHLQAFLFSGKSS